MHSRADIARMKLVEPSHALPIKGVFLALWRQRSSRDLIVAIRLFCVVGYGIIPWQAACLMRRQGLGSAEFGFARTASSGISECSTNACFVRAKRVETSAFANGFALPDV